MTYPEGDRRLTERDAILDSGLNINAILLQFGVCWAHTNGSSLHINLVETLKILNGNASYS